MTGYGGYLIETFVTLVGVCALAFAVLYAARRIGVGRASGAIQLVGQLPLEARRAIYLVKVGAQVFVVGASEAGFTKIGEIPAGELPEGATAAPGGGAFAEVLARALGRREKAE